MRWKVLLSAPYMQPVVDRFRPVFDDHGIEIILPPVNERLSEEELLQWVGDVDGIICGDDQFAERVLQAAPRLRVISKWGTGIDSIDLDACEFIRRFLLHVLPKKFVKIRYYGLLGCKNKEKKIALCRKLLGEKKDEIKKEEIPECWEKLYEFITGNELSTCPYCKNGKLIYVKSIPRKVMPRGP